MGLRKLPSLSPVVIVRLLRLLAKADRRTTHPYERTP